MRRKPVGPAIPGVPGPQERRSPSGGAPAGSAVRSSILDAKDARNRAPRTLVEELREKHPVMARQAANGSRRAAIRLFCLDCMAGSAAEVARYASKMCPLWPYRKGRGTARRPPGGTGGAHG